MEWLRDSYTFTAGDAAAGFTGRGWNWETRKWETLSLANLKRSHKTNYRLRAFHIFLLAVSTLGIKKGIFGALYVVADPLATDLMIRLPATELQGGKSVISFIGDFPMLCGVCSRLNIGCVDTGDRLDTFAGYE
jgi:hypothetical protein